MYPQTIISQSGLNLGGEEKGIFQKDKCGKESSDYFDNHFDHVWPQKQFRQADSGYLLLLLLYSAIIGPFQV